ncbi:hypothetical protein K438DRAFT_1988222 [Mycena galopus ATCC 62051]|nr:hypothetical protein K438DRAFT_1988222 [Mycena galopus ATCC 62051]
MSTDTTSSNKAAWLPAPKATLEVGPAPMPTPSNTEGLRATDQSTIRPFWKRYRRHRLRRGAQPDALQAGRPAEYTFDYNSETLVDDIVTALQGKGEMAGIFSAIVAPAVVLQCAVVAGRLEGRKHVTTARAPQFPTVPDWPDNQRWSSGIKTVR